MQKDSLETLLLRHYGHTAPTGLEEQLLDSVRFMAQESRQEQQSMAHLRRKRVSRRYAVKLVAIGTTGLGLLGASLELAEAALIGQDATQRAFP